MRLTLKHVFGSFLTESKQQIINLGVPDVIASLFMEAFGKKSFLLAKWFRDYYYQGSNTKKDWLKHKFEIENGPSLYDWTRLYQSTFASEEIYNSTRKDLNLYVDPDEHLNKNEMEEVRSMVRDLIKEKLFGDSFFSRPMIEDIKSEKLTDLKPYSKMSFQDAADSYDKKRVFSDTEPLKVYKNGFKWINVGKKCKLVGKMMKNCGSAGVMSEDPDRTIITLFDKNNKAHVVVTYSPNQKRISSDEGVAGSEIKSKYHDYVLDLADLLNAKFDIHSTRTKGLKIKSILKGQLAKLKKLNYSSPFNVEFFDVELTNGQRFITNSFWMVPIERIEEKISEEGSSIKAIIATFRDIHKRNIPEGTTRIENFQEQDQIDESVKISKSRWQQLAGILHEEKEHYEEVQSDLFRGSGINASTDFEHKVPEYTDYMEAHGWGKMPPIHGVVQTVDEQDIEDYQEAEEGGYEHELDWSRPLTTEDLGTTYVNIEDGHNRAYAAKEAGVPIHVRIW